MVGGIGRALAGMTAGVHVKEGGPGGGPGGCLKGGVVIGGGRLGGGGGFGDFRLLGDGVRVGGGAPWCFGMGSHGGGNGEEGDGGGGGCTLADCCWSCVCRLAGRDLTRGSTPGTEAGDCWDSRHAGGGLTGSWAAGSNDSEGDDCWRVGQLCPFAGEGLTGSCAGGTEGADFRHGSHHEGGGLTGSCAAGSNDGEDADCSQGCVCSFAGRISAGSNGIVNFGGDLADINCFM